VFPPLTITRRLPYAALLAALLGSALPSAASVDIEASPQALAAAMALRRTVLLGEVHDNGAQHALRVEALRLRIEAGARPAIAFEQFDRERQADIDRVRREEPGNADALIEAAGARNWDWKHYRPFVQLALDFDLPIVAANLSRREAIKVSTQGWSALFDATEQAALGLDRLPAEFIADHERAVARGHCDLLPAESLPSMARAQIARDLVLARSLLPYLSRGVVLLTGNGHVRKDTGVPYWLTPEQRREMIAIGLLEANSGEDGVVVDDLKRRYDVVLKTPPADRPDPCEALRKRFTPGARP
jgi:uncharacterized iron-regulated protein